MAERSDSERLRIAAVSELLGIPVPTIRSWERRYDFPAPPRTDGSHRRYGEVELAQLRALRDLVTKGHSTKDAVALVRTRAVPETHDASPLGRVLEAVLSHDSELLRAELDAATERLGVEETIRRVVLPAMREVGARWEAGRCDVGREHLATESVRSWLAHQTFLAPPPFRPRPIVLASGPQDLHTIGLESFAVILARRGWACRLLGARTPPEALVSTVRAHRAVAAVVTAQRAVTRRSAVVAIDAVSAVRGVHAFYAGNAFVAPATRKGVNGTYLGEDLVNAAAILDPTTR
jgi:DNA-binding transcriptional MerR regulator